MKSKINVWVIGALLALSAGPLKAQYFPPDVSLGRKSLRIINMHGAAGLPKGASEMFIQHRFGNFGSGAYNWYG